MRWIVKAGDILDEPADVLVCSANPYLTLSGGVGGAFLLRYGSSMQDALNAYLSERSVRHVPRGTLVPMPPCGSPYRAVLHAVAVDGNYQTSPEVLRDLMGRILDEASRIGAASIALPALATGYGRLPIRDFAAAMKPIRGTDDSSVVRTTIVLRDESDAEHVRHTLERPADV